MDSRYFGSAILHSKKSYLSPKQFYSVIRDRSRTQITIFSTSQRFNIFMRPAQANDYNVTCNIVILFTSVSVLSSITSLSSFYVLSNHENLVFIDIIQMRNKEEEGLSIILLMVAFD